MPKMVGEGSATERGEKAVMARSKAGKGWILGIARLNHMTKSLLPTGAPLEWSFSEVQSLLASLIITELESLSNRREGKCVVAMKRQVRN